VESTLVGSSLIGVLSQRLVRRNCQCCAEPFTPTAAEIADLFGAVPAGVTFKRGLGCASCAYTGYRGRMLVADLWVPDAQDTALIARMAPFGDLAASAVRTTLSMSEDAYARLVDGRTTPAELLRVLPYPVISTIRARSSSSPVQR
jgi:type II secretory ATPase GspE/PulE/Tfp pilus assembly ATPase PilB-like protein